MPLVDDDWAIDVRPVRRVRAADTARKPPPADDEEAWAWHIPAVRQILEEGLELPPGVTMLVGENGSGKSTVVEAIAMAFGFAPEGGSRNSLHSSRPSESPVWRDLVLERTAGAPRWGFFLRAETMHGFYSYLDERPGGPDPEFHALSHGESFLAILSTRFRDPGFYCLDEPEAALSFTSQLALIATLNELTERGGQVLCATHSPLLAALPGAHILEVGPWGMRSVQYDDLPLVLQWRAFLNAPEQFMRRIL